MSNFRLSISDCQFPITIRKIAYIVIFLACFFGMSFTLRVEAGEKKKIRARADNGYQSISDSTFREIFRDYLCLHLGKEKSDVMVSRLKVLGNKPVPSGEINFRLFQKDKRRLEGHVRLVAIISVNGAVKNKVRLSGWVDVFQSVVCACRNLKKREIIKEDDLCLVRKNISRLSSNIVTDTSKVVGLMVKHTIRKETCIKEWMLEKPLIVQRGDMITILAESGNLRVTAPGRVLAKGHMGELIKVQNSMSNKVIYAKVINNSTVRVDF